VELAEQGFDIVIHYHHSADEAGALAEKNYRARPESGAGGNRSRKLDHVTKLIPSLAAELVRSRRSSIMRVCLSPIPKTRKATGTGRSISKRSCALSRAFYEQGREGGAIVNLLDGLSPDEGFSFYLKSKHALKKETLEMAKRFAPQVRVNGIAPGPVLPNTRQSDRHFQAQLAATPLKTPIAPEDIARATAFLLTSPAITGTFSILITFDSVTIL